MYTKWLMGCRDGYLSEKDAHQIFAKKNANDSTLEKIRLRLVCISQCSIKYEDACTITSRLMKNKTMIINKRMRLRIF